MRAVGLSDLDVAVRAVMQVPLSQQEGFAADLIERAHISDIWRKRYGKTHPSGGTGSLFTQASLHPLGTASPADPRYCHALGIVLNKLNQWRGRFHKVS